MAIKEEVKNKIIAELTLGEPIAKLVKKYNVSYPTIANWKKKLNSQDEEAEISELVEVSAPTLKAVAEVVKDKAPEKVKKEVDKLVDGVIGLQKIDEKFRTVVFELLSWAEERVQGEMTIKEWQIISQSIGNLYTAIFSKNITNVNVMNNTNINGEKRQIFKSMKGV